MNIDHIENLFPGDWIVITDCHLERQFSGDHEVAMRGHEINAVPVCVQAIAPPFVITETLENQRLMAIDLRLNSVSKVGKDYLRVFRKRLQRAAQQARPASDGSGLKFGCPACGEALREFTTFGSVGWKCDCGLRARVEK